MRFNGFGDTKYPCYNEGLVAGVCISVILKGLHKSEEEADDGATEGAHAAPDPVGVGVIEPALGDKADQGCDD